MLSEKEILKHLKKQEKFNIIVKDKVDSTNILLKEMAKQEAPENTVIIADSQTNGRGRFDRHFFSPENTGIYMSILLKPTLPAEKSVLLTAAAAVAVANVCKEMSGKEAKIKWVNDVLIDGKKVCGILSEGAINAKTGGFDWAVLGFGINVYEPENDFASEIKEIAGAVFSKRKKNLRNIFCAEIINQFMEYYNKLDEKSFLNDYRKLSCVIGNSVTVIKNGTNIKASVIGIDDDCRLQVQYNNASKEFLSSGEISIKI